MKTLLLLSTFLLFAVAGFSRTDENINRAPAKRHYHRHYAHHPHHPHHPAWHHPHHPHPHHPHPHHKYS